MSHLCQLAQLYVRHVALVYVFLDEVDIVVMPGIAEHYVLQLRVGNDGAVFLEALRGLKYSLLDRDALKD